MTKIRVRKGQHGKAPISEAILNRLLHVPMVRLVYTVKDVPGKGQSLPKSVRVCDINHVRYFVTRDIKIGKGQNNLLHQIGKLEWFQRQCLHVYNPYCKFVLTLVPQRIFQDHADDCFAPKMIVHPEWEKEFRRFVEVSGIAEIPKSYQHVVDSYAITEGERAYYDWRAE